MKSGSEKTDASRVEWLAGMIDGASEAVVSTTLDGVVVTWNPAAQALYGFAATDMIGTRADSLFPLGADCERAARRDTPRSAAERLETRLCKDGRAIALRISETAIHAADGKVLGFVERASALPLLDERGEDATAAALLRTNVKLGTLAKQLGMAQTVAGLGSWSFEIATDIVWWSDELFRMFGLEPGDAAPAYSTQSALYTPASWAILSAAVARAVVSGEGYELELEFIHVDGERRWARARAQSHRDASGAVAQLVGTLQDVTELTNARRARERADERVRLATSATHVGIWDWDIASGELVWDDTMFRLYDVAPDAHENRYDLWLRNIHFDDRGGAETAIQEAMSGRGEFDTSFRVVRADGSIRHIRGLGTVQRDASGNAVRMIGVNWDETPLQSAKLALRSSEALLREFVRHTPAAIAMLDQDLRYIQTSERWDTDYHLGGQDLVGRCHYDVFPDIPQRWKDVHQRTLAGSTEGSKEDYFPRADGSLEWLQWEVRPWNRADGSIGGVIFFTQVITARKELELRSIQQQRDLERSNRDLEQFAYAASHDLQEPLRAVSGCAQILERRYADELDGRGFELIEHIVEGAARMRTLIDDLLSYSRVSTQAAQRDEVESAVALERAMRNLSTAVSESAATIEIGPLPAVRADANQLVTVFQNLIGNAIKYRSAAPLAIQVGCTVVDGTPEFFVRDNGIGIDPAHFARIFVLFQRLHTRAEYSGTGIGLSLCKAIVERHGGEIRVLGSPGAGSEFRFTLASRGNRS